MLIKKYTYQIAHSEQLAKDEVKHSDIGIHFEDSRERCDCSFAYTRCHTDILCTVHDLDILSSASPLVSVF